jgi:hypothetical protein
VPAYLLFLALLPSTLGFVGAVSSMVVPHVRFGRFSGKRYGTPLRIASVVLLPGSLGLMIFSVVASVPGTPALVRVGLYVLASGTAGFLIIRSPKEPILRMFRTWITPAGEEALATPWEPAAMAAVRSLGAFFAAFGAAYGLWLLLQLSRTLPT